MKKSAVAASAVILVALVQPSLAREAAPKQPSVQATLAKLFGSTPQQPRRFRKARVQPQNPLAGLFGGTQPKPAEPQVRGPRVATEKPAHGPYAAMVERHAALHGVPASLVHRTIMRESRYNPRALNKGNYGLMQIRYGTARAMGYTGTPAGLLDPETNLTYAVRYLAGAYRAANGNPDGALRNYQRGYYAKRRAPDARIIARRPAATPAVARND